MIQLYNFILQKLRTRGDVALLLVFQEFASTRAIHHFLDSESLPIH